MTGVGDQRATDSHCGENDGHSGQKGSGIPAAARMTDGLVKATREDENSLFMIMTGVVDKRASGFPLRQE